MDVKRSRAFRYDKWREAIGACFSRNPGAAVRSQMFRTVSRRQAARRRTRVAGSTIRGSVRDVAWAIANAIAVWVRTAGNVSPILHRQVSRSRLNRCKRCSLRAT